MYALHLQHLLQKSRRQPQHSSTQLRTRPGRTQSAPRCCSIRLRPPSRQLVLQQIATRPTLQAFTDYKSGPDAVNLHVRPRALALIRDATLAAGVPGGCG